MKRVQRHFFAVLILASFYLSLLAPAISANSKIEQRTSPQSSTTKQAQSPLKSSGKESLSSRTARATSPSSPALTDTDGDGVPDATDLDDDNDGVLDTAEDMILPACGSSLITPTSVTIPAADRATWTNENVVLNSSGMSSNPVTLASTATGNTNLVDYYWLEDSNWNNANQNQMILPLPANSNIGSIVIWANSNVNYYGDGPLRDFTVTVTTPNGSETVGPYRTIQPTNPTLNALGAEPKGAQQFFFGKTFANATSVTINTINGWFNLNTQLPGYLPAASNQWIPTDSPTLQWNSTYNMTIGEVRLGCGTNSSPLDTDGDGVIDSKDLDSDNDGIADMLEAGGLSANQIATLAATYPGGRYTGPVNAQGIPLAANGGAGYTRGTGTNLDADNDGIPDAIEAQPTTGYVSVVESSVNSNGITSSGTGLFNPQDTDKDGIPDFLDSDSDGDGLTDDAETLNVISPSYASTDGGVAPSTLTNQVATNAEVAYRETTIPILINKQSFNSVGTFGFTSTGIATVATPTVASASDTVVVPAGSLGAVVSSANTTRIAGSGQPLTIQESSVPGGWSANPTSVSCVDANSGTTGNPASFGSLSGNTLTIPTANMKSGANISCTFVNTYAQTVYGYKSVKLTTDTDNSGTITAGDTITYTIVYLNNGAGTFSNFQISDALPAGVTYAAAAPTTVTVAGGATATRLAAYTGTGATTNLLSASASLPANGVITVNIPVKVNAGFSGGLSNQASATASNLTGSILTDNAGTTADLPASVSGAPFNLTIPASSVSQTITSSVDPTTLTVVGQTANLKLLKSAPAATAGGTVVYTMTASNVGPVASSGTVTVTDVLPTGVSVNGGAVGSVTPGGANAANWTCNSDAASPQTVTCTSTTAIAATTGTSVFTFSANVASNIVANIDNQAKIWGGGDLNKPTATATGLVTDCTLASENTAGGSANAGCAFESTPVINIVGYKSVVLTTDADGTGTITAGDTVSYTVTYVNLGNSNATSVQINDQLPTGLTVTATGAETVAVSGTSTASSANGSYTGAAAGAVSNLTNGLSTLAVGGKIVYTIPAKINAGFTGTLSNQATLSGANMTASVLTDNAGSTADLPASVSGAPFNATIPASSVSQTITSSVDPTRLTVVAPTANLKLLKSAPAATAGGTVVYTMTASNVGPVASSGTVTVTDVLPTGVSVNGGAVGSVTTGGANAANWTCNSDAASPQTVTCTSTTAIAATTGTSVFTFSANVASNIVANIDNQAKIWGGGDLNKPTATATGLVTNCTLASENTAGGSANAGCAFESTPVINIVGYKSVVLTTDADGTGTITAGDTVSYTVTYVNLGNSNATSVQINDQLPTGLTVTATGAETVAVSGTSTASSANGSYTGAAAGAVSNLTNGLSTLAVGGKIVYTIPAKINAGFTGTLSNQATLSGANMTASVLTDNAGSTADLPASVSGAPFNATIPASSVSQTITSSVDPTRLTVVGQTANLKLLKSAPAATAGGTVVYTMTASNVGPVASSGTVTVTDVLPTGVSVNGGAVGSVTTGGANAANWTCNSDAASPQTVTCTSTTAIAATTGTSVFTFSANVASNIVANIDNQAKIWGGGDLNKPTATATGLVTNCTLASENTAGGSANAGCAFESTPVINIVGYKSVVLTTDADGTGTITAGDTVSYTVTYVNLGNSNATSVQINDQLPTGLTVTATGAETVAVSGTSTASSANGSYTGAAAGAVSNLTNGLSTLAVGGKIVYTIPAKINAGFTGTLSNQATLTGANVTASVLTDNAGSTADLPASVSGAPFNATIPASSVSQTITSAISPTTFNSVAYPSMPPISSCDSTIYAVTNNSGGTMWRMDTFSPSTYVETSLSTAFTGAVTLAVAKAGDNNLYYVNSSAGSQQVYKYNPVTKLGYPTPWILPNIGANYWFSATTDASGNLYFISNPANYLAKIDPYTNTVSLVWSTFPTTVLAAPGPKIMGQNVDAYNISFDANGDIIAVESTQHLVWKVTDVFSSPKAHYLGTLTGTGFTAATDLQWANDSGGTPRLYISANTGVLVVNPNTFVATLMTGDGLSYGDLAGCNSFGFVGGPDLKLSKSAPASVKAGGTIPYTMTVSNVGAGASSGTTSVKDALPAGVSVNGGAVGSVSVTGANAANWSCNSDASSPQNITCTSTTAIAASTGMSVFGFTANISSSQTADLVNKAKVFGGGDAFKPTETKTGLISTCTLASENRGGATSNSGCAYESTPVVNIEGFKSVKLTTDADSSSSITPGDTLTYTIQYVNESASPITNFQINDALPAGLTISATGAQTVTGATKNSAYTGAAAGAVSNLLASGTTIAGGSIVTVTIPVVIASGATGTKLNQASATFTELATPVLTDNAGVTGDLPSSVTSSPYSLTIPASSFAQTITAAIDQTSVTIAGLPDLKLSKSAPTNVQTGTSLTYTMTVGNQGTSATFGTTTVTDILPSGFIVNNGAVGAVTLSGANAANWTCNSDAATPQNIICTSTTAIPASTGTSVFAFNVAVPLTSTTDPINRAKVSGGGDQSKPLATTTGAITDCTLASENTAGSAANAGCAFETTPLVRVTGYKSVKLTIDADSSNSVTQGDGLTWTISYANQGNVSITGFQINDLLPTGISLSAAGTQTVTVSGAGTSATKSSAYLGNAAGALSNLLAAGATLAPGGVITVNIPVTIANPFNGSLSNQATASGAGISSGISTDNVDNGNTSLPSGVAVPTGSWGQAQTAAIDPTVIAVPSSSPPAIVLVKSCPSPANCETAPQLPGTDVTYKIVMTNTGGIAAQNINAVDAVPLNTDFKLGSAYANTGSTGLTFAIEYSNDFDRLNPTAATWTYTPISAGGGANAGYDRNVLAVRWRATSGTLGFIAPNNTIDTGFITKIR